GENSRVPARRPAPDSRANTGGRSTRCGPVDEVSPNNPIDRPSPGPKRQQPDEIRSFGLGQRSCDLADLCGVENRFPIGPLLRCFANSAQQLSSKGAILRYRGRRYTRNVEKLGRYLVGHYMVVGRSERRCGEKFCESSVFKTNKTKPPATVAEGLES